MKCSVCLQTQLPLVLNIYPYICHRYIRHWKKQLIRTSIQLCSPSLKRVNILFLYFIFFFFFFLSLFSFQCFFFRSVALGNLRDRLTYKKVLLLNKQDIMSRRAEIYFCVKMHPCNTMRSIFHVFLKVRITLQIIIRQPPC